MKRCCRRGVLKRAPWLPKNNRFFLSSLVGRIVLSRPTRLASVGPFVAGFTGLCSECESKTRVPRVVGAWDRESVTR